MRKLLLFLPLLLCSLTAHANGFTVVQKVNRTCSASPCAITVAAMGANYIVLQVSATNGNNPVSISCTSTCGGSFVGNHNSTVVAAGASSFEYNLGPSNTGVTPGGTSISVTCTGISAIWMWEVSTSGVVTQNGSGLASVTVATTTALGASNAPTTSAKNNVLFQASIGTGTISAVSPASYTPNNTPTSWPNGFGAAVVMNTAVNVQPTWTQTSGTNNETYLYLTDGNPVVTNKAPMIPNR